MEAEAHVLYDRYRVEHKIAAGAVGVVLAATDLRTGEDVVVKVFPRIDGDGPSSTEGVDWAKEMRLAFRLRHPNIVRCLNTAFGSGDPMLVFERIPGGSLRRAMVQSGTLPASTVKRIVLDVAHALEHAHGQGVMHRDLKPENILRDGERWLITDFGSGRYLMSGHQASTLIGSLGYMAPETFGAAAQFASDQYGLGVSAWEAMFGRLPSFEERFGPRPIPGRVQLEDVLHRMFSGHPCRRWPSLRSVISLLSRTVVGWAEDPGGVLWMLDAEGALWSDRDPSSPLWRGQGVKGFRQQPGCEPVLQAGRRLLGFEKDGVRTVYTQDLDYECLAVSIDQNSFFCQVGPEFWWSRADGSPSRRWPIPDHAKFLLTPEHRWAFLGPRTLITYLPGGHKAWTWELSSESLSPSERSFVEPIREIRRVGPEVGIVTGDHRVTGWDGTHGRLTVRHPFNHVFPKWEGSAVVLASVEPVELQPEEVEAC